MKPTLFAILVLCAPGAVAAADEPTAAPVDLFLGGKLGTGMPPGGYDSGWRVPLERPADARLCRVVKPREVGGVMLVRARCGGWPSREALMQPPPSTEELRAWRGGAVHAIAAR